MELADLEGGPELHVLDQAAEIAQRHLDRGTQVMPEGRGLGRLSMGLGDDQRVAVAPRGRQHRVDEIGRQRQGTVEARLEDDAEIRVVDVVAAAPGMQTAGEIRSQPAPQFAFDQEEEILDRPVIGQGRDVELAAIARAIAAASARARIPVSASITQWARSMLRKLSR